MNCTEATLSFYQFTAGNFVLWVASYGLIDPQEVTAWHVRRYLAELVASGKQDTTCHDHARVIEIINGFCTLQKQILELVKPVSIGAIGLRTSEIGRHIDQALLGVKSYNGKEKLQEAGIDIPDYYQEREKLWGGTNISVGFAAPKSQTNELAQPVTSGIEAAARRAAGLSE